MPKGKEIRADKWVKQRLSPAEVSKNFYQQWLLLDTTCLFLWQQLALFAKAY